jgi:hypothetical protein
MPEGSRIVNVWPLEIRKRSVAGVAERHICRGSLLGDPIERFSNPQRVELPASQGVASIRAPHL